MTTYIHLIGNIILATCLSFTSTAFASCTDEEPTWPDNNSPSAQPDNNENNSNNETAMNRNIILTVGNIRFNATLEDNATARAFSAQLPLTLRMDELNGNEKYYYLDHSLPTQSSRTDTIHAGDLLLYGSSCVVLFYKTFSSGYSYTRLGRVDNAEGLAEAVGSGSVTVTFETAENAE